jgi:hypothetical protein
MAIKMQNRLVMAATNATAADHYYPSAAGAPLLKGERVAFQLNLADTVVTFEGAIEDPLDSSGITVTWVDITESAFSLKTGLDSYASFDATGTTLSDLVDFGRHGPTPLHAWRIKSVPPNTTSVFRATALIRG